LEQFPQFYDKGDEIRREIELFRLVTTEQKDSIKHHHFMKIKEDLRRHYNSLHEKLGSLQDVITFFAMESAYGSVGGGPRPSPDMLRWELEQEYGNEIWQSHSEIAQKLKEIEQQLSELEIEKGSTKEK
jgi:Mg2+ and Co2+ transporter CorA